MGSNILIPEMIHIPAGEFWMGSEYGGPNPPRQKHSLHEFSIGKYPVTNEEYECFVKNAGYSAPEHWKHGAIPDGKRKHPVVYVSWHDANAYCDWLGDVAGKKYRLPIETEWEKAARGKYGNVFPWGNERPNHSLCNLDSGPGNTTPVNKYPNGKSPFGCYDMTGNIYEWCVNHENAGSYLASMISSMSIDVSDPKFCIARSGPCIGRDNVPEAYHRTSMMPNYKRKDTGFRCAQ